MRVSVWSVSSYAPGSHQGKPWDLLPAVPAPAITKVCLELLQQPIQLPKATGNHPRQNNRHTSPFFFCRVNDSNWLPGETEKHQSSNMGAEGLQSQEEGRKERERGERQLGLAPGLVDRLSSTAGSKWGLQQPEGSAGNPLTWPTGYCWSEKQELSILSSL